MAQTFDKKTTGWLGLWYHNDSHSWSSAVIDLSAFKSFKGTARIYMRKNKYYEKDTNRPNYVFVICDSNSQRFVQEVEIQDDVWDREEWIKVYKRNDKFIDENDNRLFTREEVREVIRGVIRDVQCGYTDLLPEDYV